MSKKTVRKTGRVSRMTLRFKILIDDGHGGLSNRPRTELDVWCSRYLLSEWHLTRFRTIPYRIEC